MRATVQWLECWTVNPKVRGLKPWQISLPPAPGLQRLYTFRERERETLSHVTTMKMELPTCCILERGQLRWTDHLAKEDGCAANTAHSNNTEKVV